MVLGLLVVSRWPLSYHGRIIFLTENPAFTQYPMEVFFWSPHFHMLHMGPDPSILSLLDSV